MGVISAAVKALFAAGAPSEAIIAAIAEMEVAAVSSGEQTAADRRRAWDREYRKSKRQTSTIPPDIHPTSVDADSQPVHPTSTRHPPDKVDALARVDPNIKLLVPSSITESKKEVEVAQGAPSTRGTRLSPDWQPREADWLFAVDRLGLESATDRTASFKDYWPGEPGQRGVKVNWDGTYRNWIRSTRTQGARAGPPRRQTAKSQFLDVARDLIESQLNEPNRSHAGPQPLGSGRGPEIGSGNKIIALVPNGSGRPVHHEGPPRSLSDFGEGLALVRGERGM